MGLIDESVTGSADPSRRVGFHARTAPTRSVLNAGSGKARRPTSSAGERLFAAEITINKVPRGHFPAKHARGLDPRVDAGSPQKMRSNKENESKQGKREQTRKTRANSDSIRSEFAQGRI
jgi:hypothetical protein